jgi:predicted aminopeptidase
MKKTLLYILPVLVLLIIWQFPLIDYGISQAKGQFSIIMNARPIEEVYSDEQVSDTVKQRIRLIQEIKQYAYDSVGLIATSNYETFYDQGGKPVLWVVSACEPFRFRNKKWSFPVIGSFSYKGFFEYNRARALEQELIESGYDTRVRTAGAWSTLGFFNDPILSNMVERSVGSMTELIIHELTHGTLFVSDSLRFNENLATFIGFRGAVDFLTCKYGSDSDELSAYLQAEEDYLRFTQHMLRGKKQLDSLYQSFTEEADSVYKASEKKKMVASIIEAADTIRFNRKDYYARVFSRYREPEYFPNNALFMAFNRYRADLTFFKEQYEEEFNCLPDFVAHYKKKYGK